MGGEGKAEKKAAKESKKKRSHEEGGEFKKPGLMDKFTAGSSGSSEGASSSEPRVKKVKSDAADGTSVADFNGFKKKKISLQEDSSKSEVYKSLFSSHKTALNKPVGNWVTFDPRYN